MQAMEVTSSKLIKRTRIEYDGIPQLTVKRKRFMDPIEIEMEIKF